MKYQRQPKELETFTRPVETPGTDLPGDELVWRQFRNGSQTSLTYIYRHNIHSLFNYGCQITLDRELVKDSIQDLFYDMINSRERLSDTNSIKFYLFKSLRNRLVRNLNKQAREILENDLLRLESFQISISHELTLINQQLDDERKHKIRLKLNELPALQRESLLLYFYEGMKYQEIADILGIKVKSVRALVYRAITSLGKLIHPFPGDMK